jgi:hypothetical protein
MALLCQWLVQSRIVFPRERLYSYGSALLSAVCSVNKHSAVMVVTLRHSFVIFHPFQSIDWSEAIIWRADDLPGGSLAVLWPWTLGRTNVPPEPFDNPLHGKLSLYSQPIEAAKHPP